MIDIGAGPSFSHLAALTDERGVFEHALLDVPRRQHGYCVDDVARALVVTVREPEQSPEVVRIGQTCLAFVEEAVRRDGLVHNRMDEHGVWQDEPGLGDWWGRAIWALGVTAAQARTELLRSRALIAFHRASCGRSPDVRARAFAALGACELLRVDPGDLAARALVLDAAASIAGPISPISETAWPWPEARLSYANAALAEAVLAAGSALDDFGLIEQGLSMLRFLVAVESKRGHLSVTGTSGRGPTQRRRQFDQQPIEVAAIADASARALDLTQDDDWRDVVGRAWAWFSGDNDSETVMVDPHTGAGFDGLMQDGRNENRGAESTLAALSTYQQARRLGVLSAVAA